MIAMQLSDPGSVTPDRLALVQIDEIDPGPDQALIDVEACVMCRTDRTRLRLASELEMKPLANGV